MIVDPSVNPTVVPYDGTKNIAAVFINYNDHGFIENYIDYVSLNFFMANINKITENLSRALIWFNISAMVRQSLVRVD